MTNLDKAVKNLQEGIERVKETTDDRNADKQASENGIAKAADTEEAADVLIVEEGRTDPFLVTTRPLRKRHRPTRP